MARPVTEGLEYFPMDVDFFDDPKILIVEEQFGFKGGYIASRLLCWIYRNGYYLSWNEDMALVFAKRVGNNITHALVNDVVNALVERGFFDKAIFLRSSILTSSGIQNRWQEIITRAKRKASIRPEYNLINSNIEAVNTELTAPNKEETQAKREVSTQSKVKESKVKESTIGHARDVSKFFGISEVNQAKVFFKIVSFLEFLEKKENLAHFLNQFSSYKKLKQESGQELHRIDNYLGTFENEYQDGKWNSENWEHQYNLFKNKNKPKEPIKLSSPKPREVERTLSREEIEQKNKEAEMETIQILSEMYEDYLQGGVINDSFGFFAKFLKEKGVINGSLQAFFDMIRHQGNTPDQYLQKIVLTNN